MKRDNIDRNLILNNIEDTAEITSQTCIDVISFQDS